MYRMTTKHYGIVAIAAATLLLTLTSGCASHKYVLKQDDATRAQMAEQIDGVSTQVEAVQSDVASVSKTVENQGEQLDTLSRTSREALERARAAGKLAEGKFLYERILSDDRVKFATEQATLTDEAKEALDRFAMELGDRNANVFVEIQGHTDSTGSEDYNLRLGEERAEAVRRYLSLEHDVPLHRMAVISYGESAPLAANTDSQGRAMNRRVALVVLQ